MIMPESMMQYDYNDETPGDSPKSDIFA